MRVNNKSFTLIEVVIAAVLLTIGVAGGIAGYKVADRQIERANIKNMLISENQTVAEKIASWDVDEHAGDLEGGKTYDVADEISNTKLAKFSPKVTYTVTDRTTPAPYKEIVVNAEVTYGGKTIKVQTEAIKVNVEEPILLFCGDGVVNQASEECEPPNTAICDANCQTIPPPPPPDDDCCEMTEAECRAGCVSAGGVFESYSCIDCEVDCYCNLCEMTEAECRAGCVSAGGVFESYSCINGEADCNCN